MALYPNGRYLTSSPGRHFGPSVGLEVYARARGDRLNRFVSDTYARTASTPDGYDVHGTVPAIKAGAMAARKPFAVVDGSANLLSGGPMTATAALCTVSQSGDLSLVVGLSGTATVLTFTGDGATLSLTIGLSGNATVTVGGNAGLSMIVPFSGTGAVASLVGAANLKGNLSMTGGWTPFTELSPENLAREVWNAVASQYNDAGTMGAKLNTASSGGVDLNALAQAVWEYATRNLSTSPPTAAQVATAILDAAQATPIHADARAIKGQTINGSGTASDPWGP